MAIDEEPKTPTRTRVKKIQPDALQIEKENLPEEPLQPKNIRGLTVRSTIVLAALTGLLGGSAGSFLTNLYSNDDQFASSNGGTITISDTSSLNTASAVALKSTPSVVTIEVASNNISGSGSGVIISEDGYIVTNNHVASMAGDGATATIRVTLSDGRLFSASVVGTDPIMDIAVIKIEAAGLSPIEWGDSSSMVVGDEAIAIGAPLGLQNTVTDGVVSAVNRSISISDSSDGYNFQLPNGESTISKQPVVLPVIQTDASINPGNSGGALLNANGQLVGINVAIASSGNSDGSIGVGFSIPSNLVKRIVDELVDGGEASHGKIGAMVSAVSSTTGVTGADVKEVLAGSPAEAAGLKAGDVIITFNGVPIRNELDITAQARSLVEGQITTMQVVRGGKTITLEVTMGAL
jgi:putative serine protease PepD